MERQGWKPLSHLEKPMAKATREQKKHMHVPWMVKLARKSHLQLNTHKQLRCSLLIPLFLSLYLLPFTFLSFLCLPSSNARVFQEYSKFLVWERERENREKDPKTNLTKGCELILISFFYQWGLYFLHFPLLSFIFFLTCNLWPFTFLFS